MKDVYVVWVCCVVDKIGLIIVFVWDEVGEIF